MEILFSSLPSSHRGLNSGEASGEATGEASGGGGGGDGTVEGGGEGGGDAGLACCSPRGTSPDLRVDWVQQSVRQLSPTNQYRDTRQLPRYILTCITCLLSLHITPSPITSRALTPDSLLLKV